MIVGLNALRSPWFSTSRRSTRATAPLLRVPHSPRTVPQQSPNSRRTVPDGQTHSFRHISISDPAFPFLYEETVGDCEFVHRGLFGDCTGTVRRLFGDCLNSHRSPGANDGRRLSRRRRSKPGRREEESFRTRSASQRNGMHNAREYFWRCRPEGLGGAGMHITDPCRLARV